MTQIAVPNDKPKRSSLRENIAILRQVWILALPVMLTNLLQSLVSVVDIFMVGRLSPIAIAAAGMSTVIRMLVLILMLSVAAGAMTLVAQAKGARDPERMSYVTRQAISSGVILAIMLGIAGFVLANPLLTFVNSGGDPEAVTLGTEYLQVLFLGTPFLVLNIVMNRLMQGAGDTVTPLILTGGLNILNIVFNYVFMFGVGFIPAYGLTGAAIGTVIARFLGMVAVLWLFYSGRNVIKILPGTYKPDWQLIKDILVIGVPSGLQGVFRNGSRLLVIGIVTSTAVGTYGAAALAIGFQVESLVFMPGLGINVAATSLVGQSLGRWQPEEARKHGNIAIGLGLFIMTVMSIPIVIFAPQVIQIFDPSAHPVLLEAGTHYLRISTVALPLAAIAIVANGALRGAGDSFPGMFSTMLTRGLATVVLAYVLAIVLDLGADGVWLGIAIGVVLDTIYMGWRWRGSAWLTVALEKAEIYRQHLKHLPEAIQQQFLREVRQPLMAEEGTLENITSDGVIYYLSDRDVTVQFSPDKYKILEATANN